MWIVQGLQINRAIVTRGGLTGLGKPADFEGVAEEGEPRKTRKTKRAVNRNHFIPRREVIRDVNQ